jgi:cobyrinic acid a,c-diamide synthase
MKLPPGLIVSAPASGTGKTTVTLGLLAALRARGMAVQPFKCGPDYIDPAFHAAAAGLASYNLDSWAMPPDRLAQIASVAAGADLILAEGAMGLFDGVAKPGETGGGASADIANLTGWPVLLVLDVSGQAQSAAAVALGFAQMRAGVTIAGVILNRVASPRHEALVRAGMDEAGIRVLGALPRNPEIALPERHLGLVQAEENPELDTILQKAGAFIAAHLDLDAVIAAASGHWNIQSQARPPAPPGNRIALARDAAFSFVYPHILTDWRAAGATVLPFSPLADQSPDDSADCCWLPGGYPELHAGKIAAARTFRAGLQDFARTRPVHGECGGYMAMGQALIDKDGERHEMAGLLGLVTSYQKRKMHLGYRAATLLAPIPGQGRGAALRGHEFHYSTIIEQPDEALAQVQDATDTLVPETGSLRRNAQGGMATGTYFHLIGPAR